MKKFDNGNLNHKIQHQNDLIFDHPNMSDNLFVRNIPNCSNMQDNVDFDQATDRIRLERREKRRRY